MINPEQAKKLYEASVATSKAQFLEQLENQFDMMANIHDYVNGECFEFIISLLRCPMLGKEGRFAACKEFQDKLCASGWNFDLFLTDTNDVPGTAHVTLRKRHPQNTLIAKSRF